MTNNTSNDKEKCLIKLINETLEKIEIEILKSLDGLDPIDDFQHLKFIQLSLTNMKINIKKNNSEIIINFQPNIARIVIDTWPLDSHLGNQICEIEYLYEKFKSAHQNKK